MVGVFLYDAQPRDSWRRGRFRSAATAGMTPGSAATIAKANTDNDNELRFSYVCNDTSNAGYTLTVSPRYASSGDRIYLEIKPGSINLSQRVSSVWSSLDTSATSSTQGVEYTIRVECDGQSVKVFRTAPGELEQEILSTSSCTVASTNNVSFTPSANADYSIDNIRILSDDLSNTTTFAVNNANELTTMTDYNGSTTFGFDAWGRMTGKARGSYAATYGYRYGQMLRSVTSDFPGEGTIIDEFRGDLRLHERNDTTEILKFRWGRSGKELYEEDESGTPLRRFVGTLAIQSLSEIGNGDYTYYSTDIQRSPRRFRHESKALQGSYDFTPFGAIYSAHGFHVSHGHTHHRIDSRGRLNHAFYRTYIPSLNRWISRDPSAFIDGPNVYAYAVNNPVTFSDRLGNSICSLFDPPFPDGPSGALDRLEDAANQVYEFYTWCSDCYESAKIIRKPWTEMYNRDTYSDNFMRHCGATCNLAREKGADCAAFAANMNERLSKQRPAPDPSLDKFANEIGQACAEVTRTQSGWRDAAFYGCQQCCLYYLAGEILNDLLLDSLF